MWFNRICGVTKHQQSAPPSSTYLISILIIFNADWELYTLHLSHCHHDHCFWLDWWTGLKCRTEMVSASFIVFHKVCQYWFQSPHRLFPLIHNNDNYILMWSLCQLSYPEFWPYREQSYKISLKSLMNNIALQMKTKHIFSFPSGVEFVLITLVMIKN